MSSRRRKRALAYFWTDGEPWATIRRWTIPRLLRAMHSVLMCSVHITTSGIARGKPYLEEDCSIGALFLVWHDLTFLMLHLFRNKSIGVISSQSRVGKLNASFWSLYGWRALFGSTRKRGGVQVMRDVIRQLRQGQSFAFTPDGPQGPRHRAQAGAVFMASRACTVIMPCGVAASRCWRLPTWDQHLVPKPFARMHVHVAEPLRVPADLPRDEIEAWRVMIENALNHAQEVARRELERQT